MINNYNDRQYWVNTMLKISRPVLEALTYQRLKSTMPIEGIGDKRYSRSNFSHLEALARTIAGIAPWLECKGLKGEEENLREEFCILAREAITHATNPLSKDYLNFEYSYQPIVEAAFLVHGIMRAPKELWEKLDIDVKNNLIEELKKTRSKKPHYNNWILFSAMIETFFYKIGEQWDAMRIDYAIMEHENWYLGDGIYGDGKDFHWDYYNSYVIQPMLVDIINKVGPEYDQWLELKPKILKRAKRYAQIQERLISPEGTFPALGRSLAYRFGAFQHLAQMSLQKCIPDNVYPSQIRSALTTVIKKMIEAPGTFDKNGWLKVGFCGSQLDIGEMYISTGSLYLCTTVFLPLGLSINDEFWSDRGREWTSKKIWNGKSVGIDHALDHEPI
ncbi:MAG: DUF2264 domain-containing protein [Clostridiales bacterium]